MKTVLQARLGQSLNLTPQLLNSIRLLQLTGPQLELELQQALERNPLLERDEQEEAEDANPAGPEQAMHEAAAWDELPEPMFVTAGGTLSSGDDDPVARIAAPGPSDPRVRLLDTLALTWSPRELALASWWLDHTDDHGYLEAPAAQLAAEGATALGVAPAELECARQRLLHGEVPGVAAADARECLRAQLAQLPDSPARRLADRILRDQLELLAAHDLAALAAAVDADSEAVRAAHGLILGLRPHPLEEPRDDGRERLVPDLVAWRGDGRWRVALTDGAASRLRLARHCERALAGLSGEHPLRGLLEEARWLLRSVGMRNETLLRTAQVLVERQRGFLERGEEAMAPLTLREVAEAIGMHESTVSRVTSGKYIQTPRGTFELKRLFSVRLEGAAVGATAVKAMVRRLIESEPAHAPLADDVIAGLLARKGVRIARRTVAKYREQLGIPPMARRAQARAANAA